MRTVLGGQALLGFFFGKCSRQPRHHLLIGNGGYCLVFLPRATLSILWGAIGIPSLFLCLEGAFWTCTTRHHFDAQASLGEVAGRFRGSQKMCGWKTRHSQDVHPKSSWVVLFEPQVEVLPLCVNKDQELFAFFWLFCLWIDLSSIVELFGLGMANHRLEFKLRWMYWFLFDISLLLCFPSLKYVREMFFNTYITNSMAEV